MSATHAIDEAQITAAIFRGLKKIAPEADPRQVVSDLVALNQLSTTEVQPGQRLAIPTEYAQ